MNDGSKNRSNLDTKKGFSITCLRREGLQCHTGQLGFGRKEFLPHTKNDLRAYLILFMNPQFSRISTFVIFAHLLRQMSSLTDHDHHYLVHWFKRIDKKWFLSTVQRLHNFISCRLFPPKPQDLPPMAKCTWWIPSATKRRQMPDIGMLFLNLSVRRSHLVSDSLNEISRKQHDLKKKLKVTFHGEPGLDMGGLTKEWFLLLVRQIFQDEYGKFDESVIVQVSDLF
ncbi:hypothetical protein LSH36_29g07011 [Paralvinella palmiformis]|uniref:HECT-type E3 ubiquitin transferase n=1 Tax=Paralvinella palmiformis TaxID=53620 RepID=A0AAD9NG44_9ANNE|nr:hypothetical protein LSH36_29g07011 [Paralvinella palmiformis]